MVITKTILRLWLYEVKVDLLEFMRFIGYDFFMINLGFLKRKGRTPEQERNATEKKDRRLTFLRKAKEASLDFLKGLGLTAIGIASLPGTLIAGSFGGVPGLAVGAGVSATAIAAGAARMGRAFFK